MKYVQSNFFCLHRHCTIYHQNLALLKYQLYTLSCSFVLCFTRKMTYTPICVYVNKTNFEREAFRFRMNLMFIF